MVSSSLGSTSVNETVTCRQIVTIDDEQNRGDTSEDVECEGGQRLKQLLLMEASPRRLLGPGKLVQEERDSLARLNRLIQEQSIQRCI